MEPPVAHPNTGIPLHWRDALTMPGAEQVRYLAELLASLEWWRLLPAPELLVIQPGDETKARFVAVSKSAESDLIVVYVPHDRQFVLEPSLLPDDLSSYWFDPRSGNRQPAASEDGKFTTPAPGDWVLVLERSITLPAIQGATL